MRFYCDLLTPSYDNLDNLSVEIPTDGVYGVIQAPIHTK